MGWPSRLHKEFGRAVRYWTGGLNLLKGLLNHPIYEEPSRMIVMVSRIRKTLTVQQRTAAFEHTSKIAADATNEERRLREEKNERLRKLRLAAATSSK